MSMSLTREILTAETAHRLGLAPLFPATGLPTSERSSVLERADDPAGDVATFGAQPTSDDTGSGAAFAPPSDDRPQGPVPPVAEARMTAAPEPEAAGPTATIAGTAAMDNSVGTAAAPSPASAAPEAIPALTAAGVTVSGTTIGGTVTTGTATRGVAGISTGGISLVGSSVVAKAGQTVNISSLFKVTASPSNPTYLILSGLDRNEYTAGYNTANMGSLKGTTGATDKISAFNLAQTGDAYTAGIAFTYQASTGRYYNSTYGYFDQMTYTASTTTNDNTSLSVFTTNNASYATQYAANPYVLSDNPLVFGYAGSVSIVTQPAATQPAANATPNSVCSVADSFVGKAWNENGCWVLASNIAAEAGASLPLTSTSIGIAGVANGEWVVAYNGPVSPNSNWEAGVTAGEIVAFETTSGGGHITTVVSGTGSSAMLVDNIVYVNSNGSIANSANDGSAKDVIVAAPHAATQEFNGVNDTMVVVYELDTPVVSDVVSSITVAKGGMAVLSPDFSTTNPLAGQSVTQWQIYDTNTGDAITVNGVAQTADHSAAAAITVTSLSGVDLLASGAVGSDTIEVRAFNGSYWGDWTSLTATVAAVVAPTLTSQTATQTWLQGQKVSFALAANTFTDSQGLSLTYAATQSNGAALPSWLSFNAATETFSGTVPTGLESLTLKVTATDSAGLSTSETFGVTVPAAAPLITNQTATQTWVAGQKVNFALAANTFTDPQGLAMSYTATQSNGTALPSWLSFNATTETFSGTVATSAVGFSIIVTAKDSGGLSTAETFAVSTAPKAPTLTAPTAAQTWLQGSSVSFALPGNSFTDPQGEALTYSATQSNGAALPSWLSFNSKTDTFTGVVPAGTEAFTLKVTATDTSALSASETFGVTVPAAAPLLQQTANQTWTDGQKFSFSLPTGTFTDPQGQAMTYTAYQLLTPGSPLATSWLAFKASTETFSGTVPGTASGTLTLEVVARNTAGLTATDMFNVTLKAAGSGVVAGSVIPLVPPQNSGLSQLAAAS